MSMYRAFDIYDMYKDDYDSDEDIAEEEIVNLYCATRLRHLLEIAGITKNRLNNIIEILVDHYFDHDISLDYMINAIYNYVNATKQCPSDKLLTTEIDTFINDYNE